MKSIFTKRERLYLEGREPYLGRRDRLTPSEKWRLRNKIGAALERISDEIPLVFNSKILGIYARNWARHNPHKWVNVSDIFSSMIPESGPDSFRLYGRRYHVIRNELNEKRIWLEDLTQYAFDEMPRNYYDALLMGKIDKSFPYRGLTKNDRELIQWAEHFHIIIPLSKEEAKPRSELADDVRILKGKKRSRTRLRDKDSYP